jgi:hypothetical protein
MGKVE